MAQRALRGTGCGEVMGEQPYSWTPVLGATVSPPCLVTRRAPGPGSRVVLPAHNEEEILDRHHRRSSSPASAARARGGAPASSRTAPPTTPRRWPRRLAATYPEVLTMSSPTPDYGLALRAGCSARRRRDRRELRRRLLRPRLLRQGGRAGRRARRGHRRRGRSAARARSDTRALVRRLVTAGLQPPAAPSGSALEGVGHPWHEGPRPGDRSPRWPSAAGSARTCSTPSWCYGPSGPALVVTEIPVRVEERRPARSSIARRVLRTALGLRRLRLSLREE